MMATIGLNICAARLYFANSSTVETWLSTILSVCMAKMTATIWINIGNAVPTTWAPRTDRTLSAPRMLRPSVGRTNRLASSSAKMLIKKVAR